MARKPAALRYCVEYDDGTIAHFSVDPRTMRHGNHVARLIALERQREGAIPQGEIKDVWPVNP